MKSHLNETLVKVRQILTTKSSQEGDNNLAELQALLIMPIIEKIKGVLQDLLVCFFLTFFKTIIFINLKLRNFRYFYNQICHLV